MLGAAWAWALRCRHLLLLWAASPRSSSGTTRPWRPLPAAAHRRLVVANMRNMTEPVLPSVIATTVASMRRAGAHPEAVTAFETHAVGGGPVGSYVVVGSLAQLRLHGITPMAPPAGMQPAAVGFGEEGLMPLKRGGDLLSALKHATMRVDHATAMRAAQAGFPVVHTPCVVRSVAEHINGDLSGIGAMGIMLRRMTWNAATGALHSAPMSTAGGWSRVRLSLLVDGVRVTRRVCVVRLLLALLGFSLALFRHDRACYVQVGAYFALSSKAGAYTMVRAAARVAMDALLAGAHGVGRPFLKQRGRALQSPFSGSGSAAARRVGYTMASLILTPARVAAIARAGLDPRRERRGKLAVAARLAMPAARVAMDALLAGAHGVGRPFLEYRGRALQSPFSDGGSAAARRVGYTMNELSEAPARVAAIARAGLDPRRERHGKLAVAARLAMKAFRLAVDAVLAGAHRRGHVGVGRQGRCLQSPGNGGGSKAARRVARTWDKLKGEMRTAITKANLRPSKGK